MIRNNASVTDRKWQMDMSQSYSQTFKGMGHGTLAEKSIVLLNFYNSLLYSTIQSSWTHLKKSCKAKMHKKKQ